MNSEKALGRTASRYSWAFSLVWCSALAGADQLQVNERTMNSQRSPVVAADADGGFVVVWFNPQATVGEVTHQAIAGRRFASSGTPQSAEFRVDEDLFCFSMPWGSCGRREPALAIAPAGELVVVWRENFYGSQTAEAKIRGRRYGAAGAPLGPEFTVNAATARTPAHPAVAIDSTGEFVVVWERNRIAAGLPFLPIFDLYGRRFDALGDPIGADFQVNTDTSGSQFRPALVSDPNGAFVVVWQAKSSPGTDDSRLSIQARRYDASGAALGAQFQVNSYTPGVQFRPAIGMDSNGGFVVVWESWGSSGSDQELSSIQAQRFASTGLPSGPQFQVNELGGGFQEHPAVAVQPNGDFAVAWIGGDNLQARLFDALGNALGPEFRVEGAGFPERIRPSIAAQPAGEFVVAWTSYEGVGNDDSNETIQARRITADWLFLDSFETEDVLRWSGAVL